MCNLDVVFKIGQSMMLLLCLELSEHKSKWSWPRRPLAGG